MVKPPLRTKSIGFKVSEEEYAQLETAAQAEGRTLGEWCREAILRGGSSNDSERQDPALAEIVGVRLLLVNVLRPLAAGEKISPEAFDKMLDQISEVKHELAAKLQQQAARKKPQPEKTSGEGKR
jgi:mobilization protein NikA